VRHAVRRAGHAQELSGLLVTCSMGSAKWFWAVWHAWVSAAEACACQVCAGHHWTHCRACGRAGDRAGDTNSPNPCVTGAHDAPDQGEGARQDHLVQRLVQEQE
jgi:hypothetical protein